MLKHFVILKNFRIPLKYFKVFFSLDVGQAYRKLGARHVKTNVFQVYMTSVFFEAPSIDWSYKKNIFPNNLLMLPLGFLEIFS